MPSKEYYEGRELESNEILHKYLVEVLQFDQIDSDGSSKTKGDIIATKDKDIIPMSLKNVSGKNTQVHLTSLNKLASVLEMPTKIKDHLELWLGTNDEDLFGLQSKNIKLSKYEKSHNRICSHNIDGWKDVEEWFNLNSKTILNLLIGSLNNERPSKYLLWNNKNNNVLKIVEIEKLIDYISEECKWITMPSGTVLRCITPQNKPILWMQMKGNRESGGYNHAPQFHIVENWPEKLVMHSGTVNYD